MALYRLKLLAPAVFMLTSIAYAQQQSPATVPAGTVPITSQTPSTPGAETQTSTPLTKKELKAQKKQQKSAEKAANESAKAHKDQANALKHQDAATNAQQKAQTPQ